MISNATDTINELAIYENVEDGIEAADAQVPADPAETEVPSIPDDTYVYQAVDRKENSLIIRAGDLYRAAVEAEDFDSFAHRKGNIVPMAIRTADGEVHPCAVHLSGKRLLPADITPDDLDACNARVIVFADQRGGYAFNYWGSPMGGRNTPISYESFIKDVRAMKACARPEGLVGALPEESASSCPDEPAATRPEESTGTRLEMTFDTPETPVTPETPDNPDTCTENPSGTCSETSSSARLTKTAPVATPLPRILKLTPEATAPEPAGATGTFDVLVPITAFSKALRSAIGRHAFVRTRSAASRKEGCDTLFSFSLRVTAGGTTANLQLDKACQLLKLGDLPYDNHGARIAGAVVDTSAHKPTWIIVYEGGADLAMGTFDRWSIASTDHNVPRAWGGPTRLWNMQLMRRLDNCEKGDEEPPIETPAEPEVSLGILRDIQRAVCTEVVEGVDDSGRQRTVDRLLTLIMEEIRSAEASREAELDKVG